MQGVVQGTQTVGSAGLSCTAPVAILKIHKQEREERCKELSARQLFLFVLLTNCSEDRAGRMNMTIGLLCSMQTPNKTGDG